jgi:hypothetical protein
MCGTCIRIQVELSYLELKTVTCRGAITKRTPADHQFEILRTLNDAELKLKIAEDVLTEHRLNHPEWMREKHRTLTGLGVRS